MISASAMSARGSEPGVLHVSEGVISYAVERLEWSLQSDVILVVGEYTTDSGPYENDWFICFLITKDGSWYEASAYARGVNETLAWLGQHLGGEICLGLTDSTSNESRVIWPLVMQGMPLLEIQRRGPNRTWQRLLQRCGLWFAGVRRRIHPEVLHAIRQGR